MIYSASPNLGLRTAELKISLSSFLNCSYKKFSEPELLRNESSSPETGIDEIFIGPPWIDLIDTSVLLLQLIAIDEELAAQWWWGLKMFESYVCFDCFFSEDPS